eukprot:scaffold6395_cov159-Amphora_coffeaeformis.AAC.4
MKHPSLLSRITHEKCIIPWYAIQAFGEIGVSSGLANAGRFRFFPDGGQHPFDDKLFGLGLGGDYFTNRNASLRFVTTIITSFVDARMSFFVVSDFSLFCTPTLYTDTAKARLQAVSHHNYTGPVDVLYRTFQSEGIKGLYRGFGAVIVGGTPGTVMYLCSYEIAKDKIGKALDGASRTNIGNQQQRPRSTGSDFLMYFSSGMIAEAIACIVYVPVDVIKERIQVQHSSTAGVDGQYRNSWHAVQTISRNEGFLTLYRGYGATLLSFGSYSGFFFLFYESLLKQTRQYLSKTDSSFSEGQREVPFHWTLFCSCAAGAAASWLTSPLDMAKLRLQVQRGRSVSVTSANLPAYRGMIDCLVHSYQQGGMAGLFRGAGARVLHFAPATTVTMTAYESCRTFFAKIMSKDGSEPNY